jgi:antitoxin MazE
MRAKLVSIGEWVWIRIPRAIAQQAGLTEEAESRVEGDCLIVRPVRRLRAGWEESFRKMHEKGSDCLLDEVDAHALTDRDDIEWAW